ncbi:hypothetical protein MHYP_G00152410 [Metynnis hypsauchen]
MSFFKNQFIQIGLERLWSGESRTSSGQSMRRPRRTMATTDSSTQSLLATEWISIGTPAHPSQRTGRSCHLFHQLCVEHWREFGKELAVAHIVLMKEFCQGLDRTDKNFAYTYENWCSDGLKLVEVKLQHKSLYNGLESEHWWVLSNNFYNLSTLELPPQYFACASAVACIKRIGSIREVKVYLRTESSQTSVQNIMLQTRVSRTNKPSQTRRDVQRVKKTVAFEKPVQHASWRLKTAAVLKLH